MSADSVMGMAGDHLRAIVRGELRYDVDAEVPGGWSLPVPELAEAVLAWRTEPAGRTMRGGTPRARAAREAVIRASEQDWRRGVRGLRPWAHRRALRARWERRYGPMPEPAAAAAGVL